MAYYKFLWTAPILAFLLIYSMTATVSAEEALVIASAPSAGAVTPLLVRTPKKSLAIKKRVKVRASEEKRFASLDKSYTKHMKTLARQYKASAKLVKKQGGDPTVLYEAAAYFENQSKVQDKKEKVKLKTKPRAFYQPRASYQ